MYCSSYKTISEILKGTISLVCVNRSPECAIWLNYEVVEFQPQSLIDTVLDSFGYCFLLLTSLPCYYILHLSFHMRSSAHVGITCLRPSISSYRTSSTAYPGVSRLHTSIPTTRSTYLPSPGPNCVTLPSCPLWLLTPRKIYSRVAPSCLL